MKEVVLIIDTKGNIKSDARGFQGKGCTEATAWLKTLGDAQITFKPEWYLEQNERIRVDGGGN